MNETPTFLTFAAFARLHGVSRPTVNGWKRRGYLVLRGNEVDVAASNVRLAARPDVSRGGPTKVRPGNPAGAGAAEGEPGDGVSMHEARRREMVATAKMRELALAREAGLVVPKADVLGAVRAEYTIVRTAMLGLAPRLAHRLAAATTPEACSTLLDTEVRALLEALIADGGAE